MNADGPVKGTLQFYEQNLQQATTMRRRGQRPPLKKTNSTPDDDRWSIIIDYQLAKFDEHLVTVRRIHKNSLKLTRDMKQELHHIMGVSNENLNPFFGLINERDYIFTVHAYGPRRSLNDLLRNEDLRLDRMFKISFMEDIVKGLRYLHEKCKIGYHGNLKSSNSVVDAYWRIKLSTFGMKKLRDGEPQQKPDDLLWTAPEILRRSNYKADLKSEELAKADVYSLGILLYEIYGRQGPFGDDMLDTKEIIEQLKFPTGEPTRPDLRIVEKAPEQILDTIKICWCEDPSSRPPVKKIKEKLKPISKGLRSNIADNIMELLDRYRFNLEDVIKERTEELEDEKRRNESLLLQMLPRTVADSLKNGRSVDAEYFEAVTIYFSDIVGFTALSSKSSPLEIVDLLNDLYTTFDTIIDKFDCYKVETIGDAYMFVSGLPEVNGYHHAGEVCGAALELLLSIQSFKVRHSQEERLKLRIGVHTGSVVTGVVGVRMPRYCLFGDTVITASNMESSGEPMKIQLSVDTFRCLTHCGGHHTSLRGDIELKTKHKMLSYWLHSYDVSTRMLRMKRDLFKFPRFKKFLGKYKDL